MSEPKEYAPNISLQSVLELRGTDLIALGGFIRGLCLVEPGAPDRQIKVHEVIKDARKILQKIADEIDRYESATQEAGR